MPNERAPSSELRSLVQMRRRGVYIYALPNLLTSCNFVLGFLAIIFAVDQKFISAAWAILLSSIFDLLDGRVARLTNTTSRFGVEYDSLCDLVSFGVAPAMLMYFSAMFPYQRVGVAAAAIYGLCGALRLARFNVLSSVLPKSYFQGLPIPVASMVVATGFLFSREIDYKLEGSRFVVGMSIVLGLLMVSTFRFPSFKDFHFRQRRNFSVLALVFTALVGLVAWFEVTAFLIFVTYIVGSLLLDLLRFQKRWLKKPSSI